MKLMAKAILGLFCALALAQVVNAGTKPTPVAVAEVQYLLDYVGRSECDFYRNGVRYDSGAAKLHLRYKYDALVGYGQIRTADDFIEKAATKSSLTGIAYKVRCAGGPELSSSQWLRDALAMYRSKVAHDTKGALVAPRPAPAGTTGPGS
jgi:hypothetical protein